MERQQQHLLFGLKTKNLAAAASSEDNDGQEKEHQPTTSHNHNSGGDDYDNHNNDNDKTTIVSWDIEHDTEELQTNLQDDPLMKQLVYKFHKRRKHREWLHQFRED